MRCCASCSCAVSCASLRAASVCSPAAAAILSSIALSEVLKPSIAVLKPSICCCASAASSRSSWTSRWAAAISPSFAKTASSAAPKRLSAPSARDKAAPRLASALAARCSACAARALATFRRPSHSLSRAVWLSVSSRNRRCASIFSSWWRCCASEISRRCTSRSRCCTTVSVSAMALRTAAPRISSASRCFETRRACASPSSCRSRVTSWRAVSRSASNATVIASSSA
mmetsp:Transcript_28038/g.71680  ORF Transcript_28038/g.71680 Transcript_28038/m.71680 type:complete len:229 (-) Transcript_28038:228-914(-)